PTGSFCSVLSPQSVGGGALLGDSLAENPSRPGQHEETYTASQAFPGDYEVRLDRVWGRPPGDKVQLQIIRHHGTKDQSLELMTVRVPSNHSQAITVHLDGGRRTETAYVPPPAALQPLEKPAPALEDPSKVLARLRALADPEVTDYDRRGLKGDVE